MSRLSLIARLAGRAALLAVVWWVLADGSFSTWGVGVAFVLLATAVTWWLFPLPEPRGAVLRRVAAGVSLAGWFLWRSASGGLDVARRAITRVPDTDPEYLEHRFRIPPGAARVAVLYMTNLMPGSLSVELRTDSLRIQSISRELPTLDEVAALEQRVAAVAGLDLDP